MTKLRSIRLIRNERYFTCCPCSICIMIDAFLFFCVADVDTAAATIARTDGTRLLTLSLLNEKVIVKY